MIAEQIKRDFIMGGINGDEMIPFSVDEEDFGFISSILTDRLYSDKPMAVVREYVCNAIDANILAKSKKNVQIFVPTDFEPVFKTRDFGSGLSPDEIKFRYVKLGKSDKRETNDVTGLFGLGCKAGFAYTDAFTVTSWYKGTCSIYTAQKDDNSRLQMIPVGSHKSDEPSGIEVAVPVNKNDVDRFKIAIRNFCKYCAIEFDFNGDFDIPKPDKVLDFGDFFIEKREHSWSGGKPKIVMGNVCYPIDVDNLEYIYRSITDVVFYAPIGSIDMAPDREKLEYTQKTIDYLNSAYKDAAERVNKDIQDKINVLDRPYDAFGIVSTAQKSFGSLVKRIFDFSFKGKPFPKRISATFYEKRASKYILRNAEVGIFDVGEKTVIVIAPDDARIYPSRIAAGYEAKHGFRPSKIILSDSKDVFESLMCEFWDQKQVIHDYKAIWKKVSRASSGPRQNVWVYRYGNYHSRVSVERVWHKYYVEASGKEVYVGNSEDNRAIRVFKALDLECYAVTKGNIRHLDSEWKKARDVCMKLAHREWGWISRFMLEVSRLTGGMEDFYLLKYFGKTKEAKTIKKASRYISKHNAEIKSFRNSPFEETSFLKPLSEKEKVLLERIREFVKSKSRFIRLAQLLENGFEDVLEKIIETDIDISEKV